MQKVWRGNNPVEVGGDNTDPDDSTDVELDDDDKTYKVVCEDWLSKSSTMEDM